MLASGLGTLAAGAGAVLRLLSGSAALAADMRLRSDLMIRVQQEVATWGITQTAAAGRLGITQPRLNDLLRGKVGKFSLGALVDLATRAGLQVRVEVERVAA